MRKLEDTTWILPGDDAGVAEAAALLKAGKLVGLPTETVYGLAASARDAEAVASIYRAKGRPQDNPLIVHIADFEMLDEVAATVPRAARKLAANFWPGPLTIILPRGESIPAVVSAGMDTVAIRMPSHPVARAVIRACGLPLAAPSGNRSGMPSPTTAAHMYEHMRGRIPLILDGGPCQVGVESTVLSLCGEQPLLLRPGAVTPEQLSAALGREVQLSPAILEGLQPGQAPQSPGMKYKHYAPKARVTLVDCGATRYARYVNEHAEKGCMALCFAEDAAALRVPYIVYGGKEDAASQARQLFGALRQLDEQGAVTVLAHCPKKEGVALAVYNRLLRAAAFRVIKL